MEILQSNNEVVEKIDSPKLGKLFAAFLGTIVEYYDYSLYAFSAGIISAKFFPPADQLTALSYVFAVYMVAYIPKPLGSLLFGYIGDTFGRKYALRITIIGISIPTTIIGILPEYSELGILCTILLIVCRFLQGIFVAGEYDGAAIYVIEHLGSKYQYTASAITRCTGVIGLLLGIAATNFFGAHIFPSWGWRIPFLISLPLALLTLYYRKSLVETPEFEKAKPKLKLLKPEELTSFIFQQWKTILVIIFFAGSFGATYQISIIFMKQYLPILLPQSKVIISSFSILLVISFGIMMPISGVLADKFGKPAVVKYSTLGTLIASSFLMVACKHDMLNLALASSITLACSVAPFNALAHGSIIKTFSVTERYRGVGLGHTIGSMLMSGSANWVCIEVMQKLNFNLFPIMYVMMFSVIYYYIANNLERNYFIKSASVQPNPCEEVIIAQKA